MTDAQTLLWIYTHLGPFAHKALLDYKAAHGDTPFEVDDLCALTMREVRDLIVRYVGMGIVPAKMWELMRGDYSRRPHDTEKCYHGYGVTQIDIASFPAFVRSGDWKDPYKCYRMSLDVLRDKQHYIQSHAHDLSPSQLKFATLSGYNCGEGNVVKALRAGHSTDHYTTGGDYATAITRYRGILENLPEYPKTFA